MPYIRSGKRNSPPPSPIRPPRPPMGTHHPNARRKYRQPITLIIPQIPSYPPSSSDSPAHRLALPSNQSVRDQPCKALGFTQILQGIRVIEGIHRLYRPSDGGHPVASGPTIDLSDIFRDECMSQLMPQSHAPEPVDGMDLPSRRCDGKLGLLRRASLLQTADQIARKKWAIAGDTNNPIGI